MGLFSQRPEGRHHHRDAQESEPINESWAFLVGDYPDKDRDRSLKALAKSQPDLRHVLDPDEQVTALLGCASEPYLFAATNSRCLLLRPKLGTKQISYQEVAGTNMVALPNNKFALNIESHASRMNYRPDDWKRFQGIIQVTSWTPQPLRGIEALLPSTERNIRQLANAVAVSVGPGSRSWMRPRRSGGVAGSGPWPSN
jgi:hypothetical protein